MTVYVAVTRDKYELPIAVSDAATGLSRMLGLKRCTVSAYLSHADHGKVKGRKKYIRVEINDKEDEQS